MHAVIWFRELDEKDHVFVPLETKTMINKTAEIQSIIIIIITIVTISNNGKMKRIIQRVQKKCSSAAARKSRFIYQEENENC